MSNPQSALLTDLYQLTMAHAYFEQGMRDTAVFELFVRSLPPVCRFLVAAGLEQIVEYLEDLRFSSDDVDYLESLGLFSREFLQHLLQVRFTGSVHAVAEGTPFFANEPIVRVTAPILEAQLVESRLLNLAHFQTLIASKAARCVLAAKGRRLVDFGMRRAHGAEAAVYAARAGFLAGLDATATVEAGRRFGIPLSGTMGHSFIEAHDREVDAFRSFVRAANRNASLLIDTYDTERAALRVAELARELIETQAPGRIQSVRIDSGDLAAQARSVRRILDAQGAADIEIVASGGLDEYQVESLLQAGAPIAAFGIGTNLDVSVDAPTLDMVYKLQMYANQPRRKVSPGKETWPGTKQVFRELDADGKLLADWVGLEDEALPGEPLLREVVRNGLRIVELPSLRASRDFCATELGNLSLSLRKLDVASADDFPVRISDRVRALIVDATT